jgi:hypothetical protein
MKLFAIFQADKKDNHTKKPLFHVEQRSKTVLKLPQINPDEP